MPERLLILGGGCAALEAAQAARERDAGTAIAMLSAESAAPYRRPALTKMLSGGEPPAFLLKKPEFYRDNRIDLELNCEAVSVNTFKREVAAADGRSFRYDRLLFATGGRARFFNWPGGSLPGVSGCRTLADLQQIRAAVDAGIVRRAAVIGGGLLGLEMADSLHQGGIPVTVIEGLNRLLPRQLDEAGSRTLEQIVAAAGSIELRLGVQVKSFQGSDRVAGVELTDGTTVAADLVIVAVGMTPNDEIAAKAGLAVNSGIVTDNRCRTSAPEVFAAGDCARVAGFNMGLWMPARDQGIVAGRNMAGGEEEFTPGPAAARLAAFGTRLFSLGVLSGDRLCKEDDAGHIVRSFYLEGGKLQGAMLLGDLTDQAKIEKAILDKADRRELLDEGVLKS